MECRRLMKIACYNKCRLDEKQRKKLRKIVTEQLKFLTPNKNKILTGMFGDV